MSSYTNTILEYSLVDGGRKHLGCLRRKHTKDDGVTTNMMV